MLTRTAPLPDLMLRRTVPTSTTPLSRSYASLPRPARHPHAQPCCCAFLAQIQLSEPSPSPAAVLQTDGSRPHIRGPRSNETPSSDSCCCRCRSSRQSTQCRAHCPGSKSALQTTDSPPTIIEAVLTNGMPSSRCIAAIPCSECDHIQPCLWTPRWHTTPCTASPDPSHSHPCSPHPAPHCNPSIPL